MTDEGELRGVDIDCLGIKLVGRESRKDSLGVYRRRSCILTHYAFVKAQLEKARVEAEAKLPKPLQH